MPILELKEKLGFEAKDEMLFGEKDGYHFSLSSMLNVIMMDGMLIVFKDSLTQETCKEIHKRTNCLCCLKSSVRKNDALFVGFPVKYPGSGSEYQEICLKAIDKVLEVFRSLNLMQGVDCPFCHQPEPQDDLKWQFYNYFYYVPYHDQCLQKSERPEVTAPKPVKPKRPTDPHNLVISIVLAIIGGIIGLVPIVYFLFTTSVSSYLYAIIPLFSYLGYRIGRAPRKRYMTYIIIGISISLVVITEILWAMLQALLAGLTLFEALAVKEFLSSFLTSISTSLFCIVIGIVLTLGLIGPKE
jgi:hypothetical protein